MDRYKRRCRICLRRFQAGRRTQKICSRRRCQKDRHRRSCLIWHKKHPHRDQKRRLKVRGWAKAYPNYWRRYRASHPDYAERERRRMWRKRRRALRVAKRDARRVVAVEKLAAIVAETPKNVAKRDACDRRVDKVLDFLIWKEASQNGTQPQAA
jgi:hypothetical protein